jgi:hypothetical protein
MPYKKHLLSLLKTLEGTAIINNEMRKDISQIVKLTQIPQLKKVFNFGV